MIKDLEKRQANYRVGDEVTWVSQSNGSEVGKIGKVFAIVPAGRSPLYYLPRGYRPRAGSGYGASRNHKSYLIQVGNSKRLYWPLVKYLLPISDAFGKNNE